jgi:hypothetical protein
LLLLAAALGGCQADGVAPTEEFQVQAGAVGQNQAATYDWHAGDAFLAAINPAFAPDFASAPNGDVIEISGTGTLSLHPKSATGGGTFVHRDGAGNTIASGTFTATHLISFQSYGPSPATPPDFHSGKALIGVRLFPGGAGPGIPAILRIQCAIAGSALPANLEEGIRLTVPGGVNFNREAGGATVFILL